MCKEISVPLLDMYLVLHTKIFSKNGPQLGTKFRATKATYSKDTNSHRVSCQLADFAANLIVLSVVLL